MTDAELSRWEARCEELVAGATNDAPDPVHGLDHVRRVVASARRIAASEGADPRIVLPAAWLHDCVVVPKDSPERARASRLAADVAGDWLRREGYPPELVPPIEHAVHAHSFSAGVEPRTLEAAVVRDADRLDALGAVGLSRTLMLGGAMGRPLYDEDDPFAERRPLDDARFTVDHLPAKLLRLAEGMRTAAGRAEAERRHRFLELYLDRLREEIGA